MAIKTLAIVIPAYKIDFFEETLKSLSRQTCRDFTVYVGNDCSSSDFESLISKYKDQLDLVYHRFNENLGGKDLVGQWERCVKLTQGEPWICLFSDDDVLGNRFVELFVGELSRPSEGFDIYHFNVKVIDSDGQVVRSAKRYPGVIESWSFYKSKASAKLESYVVEYVFSRGIYEKIGGFVNFPMAWGSDIATWIKMGAEKGIKTIDGEYVYWRQSDKNITPNHSGGMVFKKLHIDIGFLKWVNIFFQTNEVRRFNEYAFFRSFFYYSLHLDRSQASTIIEYANNNGVLCDSTSRVLSLMFPLVKVAKYCKSKLS